MSTVKVAPETTWSFPNINTKSVGSSDISTTEFPMDISQDEYMYLFVLAVVCLAFFWTFKKRV
jgi:hypothetical protein